APEPLDAPLAEVARRRRSALDFDPRGRATLPQLAALLEAARAPFPLDSIEGRDDGLTLYLWAHAIEGIEPGLYRVGHEGRSLSWIKASTREEAGYVSLEQEIARDGVLALSIVADLDAHLEWRGDRGYRDALVLAGARGHALYV